MEEIKSGWKTSEFWITIGAKALVALIAAIVASQDTFPPMVRMVVGLAGPALIALIAKTYIDGRSEVKVAASNASAVKNLNDAAEKLSGFGAQ